MRYNCTFDTYRRATDEGDANKRVYSLSKTIADGLGAIGSVSGELRPILGLDSAVIAYYLFVESADVELSDKITITSPPAFVNDYFIEQSEQVPVGLLVYNKLLIRKDG